MSLGRVVIGCDFTAAVTAVYLSHGNIVIRASGKVGKTFSLGDVPVTLYDGDDNVVSTTHGTMSDFVLVPPFKGDTLEFSFILTVASTSALRPLRTSVL